jgi:hypothetical protein
MIRRFINGIRFDYVFDRHIVQFSGEYYEYKNGQVAGVRITYPDGTRRFISNSWYDKQDIENL